MFTDRKHRRGLTAWLVPMLLGVSPVSVAAEDAVSPMPDSWFEIPKTASEVGITSFSQSPMLDDAGLPPVKERLPDDPPVIEPLNNIGVFGGRAQITLGDSWQFFNWESALTISADLRNFLPNLAESWEVSPDGRITTIKLRSGLKWSDGHPLTSDDFIFTFNHIWLDTDINPVTSMLVIGGRIEKVDNLTFRYVFEDPNPMFENLIAQYGSFMVDPKHFFVKYHPSFADREFVDAKVAETGVPTWMALLDALRSAIIDEGLDMPTLRSYKIVQRTPTMVRFDRNPFYHKVDPQGQQLPYIDGIDAEDILDNAEVVTAKASTGQLDFAAFTLRTQDIPLLKLGERNGEIKVHIWRRLHSSDVAIQPNYNYADAKYRALLWDVRFRKALSLAINRPEMNEIIYFSRGVPRQVTVHPTSSYFEPHYATAHTEFDPDQARALFAEIGLKDIDGDGLVEYPDGSPLTITLEFLDFETPKGITMELVASYWREVGLDLRLKLVDRALQSARAQAGEMQMTLWHADRVTDILFPLVPDWWAPRSTGWDRGMWNDWARYYQTDGELGENPPEIIRQMQQWTDDMRYETDINKRITIGKKLLQANADNLWTIGTIGLAPHPVVVSKRLRNVLPKGIWGWDNRWTLAYHPSTWYFDED